MDHTIQEGISHGFIREQVEPKIKDNDNRYRAKKFSGFIDFVLTIILISTLLFKLRQIKLH